MSASLVEPNHSGVAAIGLLLARAEQQAVAEDTVACLATLRDIRHGGGLLAGDDADRFNRIVLRLLERAQSLFGHGHLQDSTNLFKELISVAPENQELVIESLVIFLYLAPDMALSENLIKISEERGFVDARIFVFFTEYYCRIGDYDKAVANFSRISGINFSNASYVDWKELAKGKLISLSFQKMIALRNLTGVHFIEQAFSYMLSSVACAFTESNSFAIKVAFFSFYNEYGLAQSYEVVAEALYRIAPQVDTERRAVIAAYLVAIDDRPRIEAFLKLFEGDGALWAHPSFARAVCNHARSLGDLSLERTALARVLAADGAEPAWTLSNRDVQRLELRARARTLEHLAVAPPPVSAAGNGGAPVVFVGVFGQLRHERDVLPPLADYLRREEEVLQAAVGARLQVGFSVWDSTGQRPILDASGNHGGIEVLYARLSADLVHILKTHGLHTVEGFAAAFPRTFEYAVACGREVSTVEPRLIEGLFPGAAAIDIALKAEFAAEEEALMAASSRPGPRPADWRNQLRMWHRIGAFAPMIAALEERAAAPIAAGALIRADLLFHRGSLAERLLPILEGRRQRTVCVDYDPCAIYFEGVGDRYFAGDRAGILTVAGCWERMKERIAACDGSPGRDYARRFGSHVFVGARLFEEAIEVLHVPRAQLEFDVCRGVLHTADLRPAMLEDCEALVDQALRRRIIEFLRAS